MHMWQVHQQTYAQRAGTLAHAWLMFEVLFWHKLFTPASADLPFVYLTLSQSAIHCGGTPNIVDACNGILQRTVIKPWQALDQSIPCRAVEIDCARCICAVWSHREHQPESCCQLLLLELPGRPHACAGQDQAAELAGSMTSGAC